MIKRVALTRITPLYHTLTPLNTFTQQQRNIVFTMSNRNKWNSELTPEQLHVLRDKGTERPNTGKYLHNKETGIYYCANCKAPLYASATKFESGCGWPAFYEEIKPDALKYIEDTTMGMKRVEIRCNNCGGHLGHVFEGEGWKQQLGLPKDVRHCVNSLSLNFKPETK